MEERGRSGGGSAIITSTKDELCRPSTKVLALSKRSSDELWPTCAGACLASDLWVSERQRPRSQRVCRGGR